MTVPTKQDIQKKKEALESHLKQLDEQGRLTEKKLVSMLRSAIRQVWMRAPNKLAKLEQARIADMNPDTRTKWLFKCEICNELFKQNEVEVDHKSGNHTFTRLEDFENFCDKILNASLDELQIVCKPDHEIKTHSERYGITFEEARKEKDVITFSKFPVKEQKILLTIVGYRDNEMTNKTTREKCFREMTTEGIIKLAIEMHKELEYLRYFHAEADFGPADGDVREMIGENYGKELPEGY